MEKLHAFFWNKVNNRPFFFTSNLISYLRFLCQAKAERKDFGINICLAPLRGVIADKTNKRDRLSLFVSKDFDSQTHLYNLCLWLESYWCSWKACVTCCGQLKQIDPRPLSVTYLVRCTIVHMQYTPCQLRHPSTNTSRILAQIFYRFDIHSVIYTKYTLVSKSIESREKLALYIRSSRRPGKCRKIRPYVIWLLWLIFIWRVNLDYLWWNKTITSANALLNGMN